MQKKLILCFVILGGFAFAGCKENSAPSVVPPMSNSSSVQQAASRSSAQSSQLTAEELGVDERMFMIDIPRVGIHFPYWKQLIPMGDINDGQDFPTRKGEYAFTLSHPGTGINGVDGELYGINYDRRSDGLGDWGMSLSVREQLLRQIDEKSCDLLATDKVYVPVNMQRPHLCKATITQSGSLPVIVAVGFGYPHESVDFPQSMVILFAKNKAVIVSGLLQFPDTNAAIKKLAAQHMQEYPDTEFPNAHYVLLEKRISALLDDKIQDRSSEFKRDYGLLLSVGRGMWSDQ